MNGAHGASVGFCRNDGTGVDVPDELDATGGFSGIACSTTIFLDLCFFEMNAIEAEPSFGIRKSHVLDNEASLAFGWLESKRGLNNEVASEISTRGNGVYRLTRLARYATRRTSDYLASPASATTKIACKPH